MHEFSIAESLANAVLEELAGLDAKPGKLRSVRVDVGRMRQVVPETLEFAYRTLTRGTPAEDSKLIISERPISVRCRDCDWQGPTENMMIVCGKCDSQNVDITEGKELHLTSLEFDSK